MISGFDIKLESILYSFSYIYCVETMQKLSWFQIKIANNLISGEHLNQCNIQESLIRFPIPTSRRLIQAIHFLSRGKRPCISPADWFMDPCLYSLFHYQPKPSHKFHPLTQSDSRKCFLMESGSILHSKLLLNSLFFHISQF